MTTSDLYLGIDLGGTKTAVSLWHLASRAEPPVRLDRKQWATLGGGPAPNIDRMVQEARRLLDQHRSRSGSKLVRIGVSGGGPVDPDEGRIVSIPNLAGWNDVAIVATLQDQFGVPAHLENDANACALAEWLYGAGRGARDLAFLTCSTGIGAGLILNRRLYRGGGNLAGELGHVEIVPGGLPCGCGRRGCLEAYASGTGIAARLALLRQANPSLPATAREVVERAGRGDDFSQTFLDETAGYLAAGLAPLIFCLNPQKIIFGTIVAAAGSRLLDPLWSRLQGRVWPSLLSGLELAPAGLWPDLGDYAALAVAQNLAE